jgi:hypothetical protein
MKLFKRKEKYELPKEISDIFNKIGHRETYLATDEEFEVIENAFSPYSKKRLEEIGGGYCDNITIDDVAIFIGSSHKGHFIELGGSINIDEKSKRFRVISRQEVDRLEKEKQEEDVLMNILDELDIDVEVLKRVLKK